MIRPEHDIPRNLFVKCFIELKVSRLSTLPKDISAFRWDVAETGTLTWQLFPSIQNIVWLSYFIKPDRGLFTLGRDRAAHQITPTHMEEAAVSPCAVVRYRGGLSVI